MGIATPYQLIFAAQGDLLDAARALEAHGHRDLTSHDSSSVFLTVIDAAGEVHGAARLILPGPTGATTINDADTEQAGRLLGVDAELSWEIASFTVHPGTDGRVAAALCHGIVQALRTNRVRSIVARLDQRARLFFATAGMLPGRVPGAAVDIRCARVSDLLDTQRRTNQDGYRLVSQGLGLEGVRVPHPDELLVSAPMRAGLSWTRVRSLAATA
jgi:hypothetical protein